MKNWKTGKLENWKTGKLENWKTGKRLEELNLMQLTGYQLLIKNKALRLLLNHIL